MIRVLSAIAVPPHLSVSGGARAGERLSSALAGYCDVTVASMMNGRGESPVGPSPSYRRVSVQTSLPFMLQSPRTPNRLKSPFYRSNIPELVRGGAYDIVHIHNPLPALEMARIAKACVSTRTPYVVSTHGYNEVARGEYIYGFDLLRRMAWRNLVRKPVAWVTRNADAVFLLSPADKPIVQDMGYTGDNLPIVTNGVGPLEPFDAERDASICQDLEISPVRTPGQITCMFLANHTPNKGLPILLKAFAEMTRPYLLIVGGEKRDGIDYDSARRACGPNQQVVITGRLKDSAVPALFRRSDLFVFPTLADTLPLVVLEAMSHGVPVVASDVGGIPFQLEAPSCGVLVPAGDATALRASIEDLTGDPERLRLIGRAAKARVQSEFTWDSAARKALAAYELVLKNSPLRSNSRTSDGHRHLSPSILQQKG